MTSDLRTYLRQAVDQAARQRVERENRLGLFTDRCCKDCGADLDAWTLGCDRCRDRHYKQLRRGHHPHGQRWYSEQVLASMIAGGRACTIARQQRRLELT